MQLSPSSHYKILETQIQELIVSISSHPHLTYYQLTTFYYQAQQFPLHKFTFTPHQDPWLTIGIFAGIHGDEPAGLYACLDFIQKLIFNPTLAQNCRLLIYPICNPAGLSLSQRTLPNGLDLNRIFWTNSQQPEVRSLENELKSYHFDGILALHSDDTADGIYGYVGGDLLTRHLLEPALQSASAFIPRSQSPLIDGWKATNAIIEQCFNGILTASPSQFPKPFEIVFETSAKFSLNLQISAHTAAISAILEAAIRLHSHALNL
ncbi:MAG: succinylglutamate desuccinylase/aspartoacylase family protein [Chthoniobacterales bacterium]|nr:succinylglutamate desuccinylase/aspartoacylase family protein [Chthoniobacterales bacterium]